MSSTRDETAYYQSLEDRGRLQRELDAAKREIERLRQRESEVRAEERERAVVKEIKGLQKFGEVLEGIRGFYGTADC